MKLRNRKENNTDHNSFGIAFSYSLRTVSKSTLRSYGHNHFLNTLRPRNISTVIVIAGRGIYARLVENAKITKD